MVRIEEERRFFNITREKGLLGDNKFILNMSDTNLDVMGGQFVCQKCHGMIKGKFYVCEQYKKWFCADCQLNIPSEINLKDMKQHALCDFDYKTKGKAGDIHTHLCIKGVDGFEVEE